MGLVDKLRGTEAESFSASQGVVGVALYAIIADGVVADEEMEGLRFMLGRMQLLADAQRIDAGLQKALRVAKAKGHDGLLAAAAQAVPMDMRQTTYAVAADLLFSDGRLEEDEKAALARIQRALGVPDAFAAKVVEVLSVKNRG
jgi:tellurite resistance protein